jgi:branched-chain amino acid transport system substrate-binding protein
MPCCSPPWRRRMNCAVRCTRMCIRMRPGYAEEAAAIAKHAETLGARKFAVLHGTDGESLAALDAAERTMTSAGANLLAKAPLASGSVAQRGQGHGRPPRVHAGHQRRGGRGHGHPRPARQGLPRARSTASPTPAKACSPSQLGPAGAGVVVVRVVPKSDNAKVAVTRELQADLAQAKLGKPNVYLLEGYIAAARVFTEALRRIPAKDAPNRARLKNPSTRWTTCRIGGFRVHFTEERVGSKLVELSLIDSQGRVRD